VAKVANILSGVTIDCADPQRVARFWSALLGREPRPSQDGWVYLGQRGDPEPRLVFQPVPEPKAGKVRIHLDVTVDDVDEAVELVTVLGGRAARSASTAQSGRTASRRPRHQLPVKRGSRRSTNALAASR
jgi:glyoxalase superfamily protein